MSKRERDRADWFVQRQTYMDDELMKSMHIKRIRVYFYDTIPLIYIQLQLLIFMGILLLSNGAAAKHSLIRNGVVLYYFHDLYIKVGRRSATSIRENLQLLPAFFNHFYKRVEDEQRNHHQSHQKQLKCSYDVRTEQKHCTFSTV